MHKILNIILLSSVLLSIFVSGWLYYNLTHRVGDITYDAMQDKESFAPCNENEIYQYYSVHSGYKGGRKALRQELYHQLDKNEIDFKNKSGYITVRFIINCSGQAGWFRFHIIDKNLENIDLNTQDLKKLVGSLQNWNHGELDGMKKDSYYHITFKLKNGKIRDIF